MLQWLEQKCTQGEDSASQRPASGRFLAKQGEVSLGEGRAARRQEGVGRMEGRVEASLGPEGGCRWQPQLLLLYPISALWSWSLTLLSAVQKGLEEARQAGTFSGGNSINWC